MRRADRSLAWISTCPCPVPTATQQRDRTVSLAIAVGIYCNHPDVIQAFMPQIDPLVGVLEDLVLLSLVSTADLHEMRREMRNSCTLPRNSILYTIYARTVPT